MSLYAIKNDEGKYLHIPEAFCDHDWDTRADTWDDREVAKDVTHHHGGHVVELVEVPVKVVVSEEEAEMLKTAKDPTFRPSSVITSYSSDHGGLDLTSDLEDRLMRAYVIGWTVKKPKRYVLPMEGTSQWGGDGKHKYAFIVGRHGGTDSGPEWDVTPEPLASDGPLPSISKEDYGLAPAWVKAIKPVEVTDDEQ